MQNFRLLKNFRFNNIINQCLLVILLYLYIFQPPLISKYIFLGIELLIFIVFQCSYSFKPLNNFYNNFRIEINVLILIISYALFRDLLGGEIVYSNRMFYFTFQAFFFSSFIIYQVRHKDIEQLLLYTGILGSFITLSMMIIPDINSFIMNYMREELANYDNFEIRYRGYGFSENITFTYSYVLGLCSSICILKIKKNLIWSLPFLSCLIGVAFNARVGFIPIIITICYSIYIDKDITRILKLILGILLVSIIVYSLFEEKIEIYKETSWIWISSFFYDLSDLLFRTSLQSQDSTLNTLTGSFIIFPEGITDWIFGSGKSLYLENNGNNSDIGYILQLNYGGIIYLSLICFFIGYTILRYWKLNTFTWFTIIYLTSIILLNYKGFFFAGTPGVRFIYLLYIWGILKRKNILRNEYF